MNKDERMIAARVQHLSRLSPDRPALSWHDQGQVMRTCTFKDLASRIDDASILMQSIAEYSRCVVIRAGQDADSVAAILAAEVLGYLAILFPSSLPHQETRTLLSGFLRKDELPQAGGNRVFVAGAEDCRGIAEALSGDGFIAQLTSGSTGASRFAVRSHRALSLEIDAVSSHIGLSEHDTILCASSIAHSYGLIGGLLAPLACGARVVLLEHSSPATTAKTFAVAGPTIIFGLARTYGNLLSANASAHWNNSVRLAFSAGAPLPEGLFDAFLGATGIPIRQDYGTTETGTISIDTSLRGRPQTVGMPLPHLAIRLVPPTDIPIRPQEQGEVQVRAAAVATGYLQPSGLAPCVSDGGWYPTRDIGWFSEDGLLCVGERLRHGIWAGGRPVRPEHVEALLSSIPGVNEVVALPHPDSLASGLRIVAVAPPDSLPLLQRRLEDEFGVPPDQLYVELRDSIPRSPAGKILLKYLL